MIGDKKRRENAYFFYQLVKSMHIFSPIDLKYTKLQKQKAEHFSTAARTPRYKKFQLGKIHK